MLCLVCDFDNDSLAHFCHGCGANLDNITDSTDSLITLYFHRGYHYNDIVGMLHKHGISIHVRTLKRTLREMGLKRRGNPLDEDIIREVIRREIQGAGELAGYRYIWHALRLRHHMHVPRSLVCKIMKEIDPIGVEERVARRLTRRNYVSSGPNFCWHVDGYDKLKPYGFPIHGCICGYSRRILWLELVTSNNDPKITARLYLDSVQKLKGCPRVVRSDCGTENCLIAAMQSFFRAHDNDEFSGAKAHRYGSSPSNQRIEGWWSCFRRSRSNWWIDFFKDMVQSGELELGNIFQMKCLWFCFSKLIQEELDKVRDHWNSHYIRRSRHDTVPGVPDILYYLPEHSGAVDCIVPISRGKINEMEQHCELDIGEDIYQEYFEYVIDSNGWQYPCNEKDAFNLFQRFKEIQR